MTVNIARPYNPAPVRAFPTFSRQTPDLLFGVDEQIVFSVFPNGRPLKASWALSCLQLQATFANGEGELCLDHSVRINVPNAGLLPGFYDVHVNITVGREQAETGIITFGYCVDDIPQPQSCPDDLGAFWQNACAALSGIPMESTRSPAARLSSAEVDVYNEKHAAIPYDVSAGNAHYHDVLVDKVSFLSYGPTGPKRYFGWLARPDGDGPFPGLLIWPGAGSAALPMPVDAARRGYAALLMNIHGDDIDQAQYASHEGDGYLQGPRGESKTDNYYYPVFLLCKRAAAFLASCPEVDERRLAACGGSQGGFLSIVTAALEPSIRAVASAICYHGHWPFRDRVAALNAIAQGSPEAAYAPPYVSDTERARHMSYYDAMNLATLVTAPTLMCACLSDGASPAVSVHAIHRNLSPPKEPLMWSVGTNHDILVPFERNAYSWLAQQLAR